MSGFEAGRRGESVRSDCWVRFEGASSGGVVVRSRSKVESMYGDSIRRDATATLAQLGVLHGGLDIEDQGALPFVLQARIETAVRRARAALYGAAYDVSGGSFGSAIPTRALPKILPGARTRSSRERFRRSRLYLPGNEPKFMFNAGLHRPDAVILDLEDSVAPSEKDAARSIVRNALRVLDFGSAERMVRINPLPLGLLDLEDIIPQNVQVILIPKCESAEEVRQVAERIREIRARVEWSAADDAEGVLPIGATPIGDLEPPPVFLMPILETARGILNASAIAAADPEVIALTLGLEDYAADLGTARTDEGHESLWARAMVVNAARAAGVAPIDSVFSDVADMEALHRSVLEAKGLGFEGKGCIHPRQIEVIHRGFAPSTEEMEKATRIVAAYREAEARGDAVVSLGSKMIDAPVVKRALRTLELAAAYEAGSKEALGG